MNEKKSGKKNITVIGAGSWGTAITSLLYENGHDVTLWSHDKAHAEKIVADKENKEYLPGVNIPQEIVVTSDIEYSVKNAEIIVTAVPSVYMSSVLKQFATFLNKRHTVVNISKGLDESTLSRLSEVIESNIPSCKVCVLAGPSHAEEVGNKIPTTCVASSKDSSVAEHVQDIFMNKYFRVYVNTDIIGVELGGALKNVIALAAGIADGLGLGDNTKAALMTRGMAEIARLGVKMGADPYTFSGLTGIGDLIVTCTSMHSRNRRAGILLGQGKPLEQALSEIHMVVEGVNTAKAALMLAQKHGVLMPITEEINNVLFEGKKPMEAVYDLMQRDKTEEHEYAFR